MVPYVNHYPKWLSIIIFSHNSYVYSQCGLVSAGFIVALNYGILHYGIYFSIVLPVAYYLWCVKYFMMMISKCKTADRALVSWLVIPTQCNYDMTHTQYKLSFQSKLNDFTVTYLLREKTPYQFWLQQYPAVVSNLLKSVWGHHLFAYCLVSLYMHIIFKWDSHPRLP